MNGSIEDVASRVVWWKAPAEALLDRKHFLARVMAAGTFEEMRLVMRFFSRDEFRAVAEDPPPGIFDARSWAYWTLVLGLDARDLPTRRLPP